MLLTRDQKGLKKNQKEKKVPDSEKSSVHRHYNKSSLRPKQISIQFIVEGEEGDYCAKATGHRIITQGDTYQELKNNVRDAVYCHFGEDPDAPNYIQLHLKDGRVIPI